MDWRSVGVTDQLITWLTESNLGQYVGERKLDPFATSMRNFDDVTPDLQRLRSDLLPDRVDSRQRIADLRAAHLVARGTSKLSQLGGAVVRSWEFYDVANGDINQEFFRLLLLILEARRIHDTHYGEFITYWDELRRDFNPLALIQNWDSLFILSYLDFKHDGFSPGDSFRAQKLPVEDIELDLIEFTRVVDAPAEATLGARRVERTIASKIPRGRHRATFCMALEAARAGASVSDNLMELFGVPKRPRLWNPFPIAHQETLNKILRDYAIMPQRANYEIVARSPNELPVYDVSVEGLEREYDEMVLPDNIDFSQVVVDIPRGPRMSIGAGERPVRAKKVDYIRKAVRAGQIGKLGEEFALRFERWRLRELPTLRDKVRVVADVNDSLGYDIESYELDGTRRYVEVKGTVGSITSPFFITANELRVAESLGSSYVIVRVAEIPHGIECFEIRQPFEAHVKFVPEIFVAYLV